MLTRQSVQRVGDLRVRDGFSEFIDNPDHARSPLLRLTEPGRTALARLTETADSLHHMLATHVSVDDIRITRKTLRTLVQSLQAPNRQRAGDLKTGQPAEKLLRLVTPQMGCSANARR